MTVTVAGSVAVPVSVVTASVIVADSWVMVVNLVMVEVEVSSSASLVVVAVNVLVGTEVVTDPETSVLYSMMVEVMVSSSSSSAAAEAEALAADTAELLAVAGTVKVVSGKVTVTHWSTVMVVSPDEEADTAEVVTSGSEPRVTDAALRAGLKETKGEADALTGVLTNDSLGIKVDSGNALEAAKVVEAIAEALSNLLKGTAETEEAKRAALRA